MRPTLVASLLLSPMLITASAFAIQPKSDVPAATQDRRVSTGITAPKIESTDIQIPADALGPIALEEARVVLALNVDENGNPQNVRVVKSVNSDLDARVVAAVSKAHFRPATLDHQAIPIDVNLIFDVKR